MSVRDHDDGDTGSQHSGTSGTTGNVSETSSQQSDVKFLRKRIAARGQDGANEEMDLLEQKRNFQEGVFACMYTLVRQSALSHLSFAVLKIILEFLMNFIEAFNPSYPIWQIDTSNPAWQIIRWTVWRSPIMRLYGYKTYVTIMYIMVAAVLLAVLGLVWLTLAMRKQEQSKLLRRAAAALHVVFDIMFVMCFVSFFDYLIFMADCDFLAASKSHLYFKGVMCLKMPHLLHMMVAMGTATIFLVVTALVVVASADLNPVSRAYLSTPASTVRLKILFAKAAYIIFAVCFDSNTRVQCVGNMVSVLFILFWNLSAMPFYRKSINIIWTGLWTGVLYACVVLNVVTFGKDQSVEHRRKMTQIVLYGTFPSVLAGMALTSVYVWWAMRPARKFADLQPGVKLSKVHKFDSVDEVERLARVMRKFDSDGMVDEAPAAHGETIIKTGLQTFPNAPHLLILNANFVLEVRKDGPAARTQLQLAAKHSPNIIHRYQIFCTYEASKRLKGNQQEGMDLQAYIEFKRNFRAVLRVHRGVLTMQAEVWQLCMRASLRVAQFDSAMDALEVASSRANQVYKRVLERYPNNGKLLRCYGKFLECARHDHVAAMRAYTEANRSGAGGALLSLDLSSGLHGAGKPDFLTSMSMEDDAIVVIDAEGTIMMVSQTVQKTFGYVKTELEGANVSMLMPQPFSQRHDGYLQRYIATTEPHILDSVREVVALHRDRNVFPVALCVTKLSGVGADSIFLGLIRPLPPDIRSLRAWVAPNGVFLCSDQQFASTIGILTGELVGHPLSSLVTETEAVEVLLERCKAASADDLASGAITTDLLLRHRYREPVPVHVTVRLAGTDGQRILSLHCQRTDGLDGSMLAVDTHMRIRFASCEVAMLLGYSMRKLTSMRLDQLLPPPYNALHAKWLRDPPHAVPSASCRSGAVVYLLSESGAQIPVRLQISTVDGSLVGASTLYVIEVCKVPAEELFREKRLVLTADFAGKVLSVSSPESALFGFPAPSLVGTNLADCVDIFADWRERSGDTQMQLILLALLYKEQDMPGTSWRVRIHAPEGPSATATGTLPPLAGQAKPGGKGRNAPSACLQVEMDEEVGNMEEVGADEHETRVRITLWRRDLLSGVVELDEELVIRRASPLTGLITGFATSAMLRKPLNRFLNLPNAASWDKLVAASAHDHHKKSALKATSNRGNISPVLAFVGPHPDSGTMRLMVQGVQTLGPGGRPKVTLTLHPDTNFVGAHANLTRVLKLENGGNRKASSSGMEGADDDDTASSGETAAAGARSGIPSRTAKRMKSMKQPPVPASEAETDDGDGIANEGDPAVPLDQSMGTTAEVEMVTGPASADGVQTAGDKDSAQEHCGVKELGAREQRRVARGTLPDDDGSEQAQGPGASLHRQTTTKSEFVAQWVRTLSHRVSGRVRQDGQQQPQHQHSVKKQQQEQGPQEQQPPRSPGERGEGRVALLLSKGSARLDAPAATPADGAPSRLPVIAEAPMAGEDGTNLLGPVPDLTRGVLLPRFTSVRDAARAASSAPEDGEAARRTTAHDGGDKAAVDAQEEENKAPSDGGESSLDGSQATGTVISSATDASSMSECVIDTRRSRLLKALSKLLLGPSFMTHIDRLRLQSYLLIAIMFLAHVISYSVITALLKDEHKDVYSVHRQAMAMDRSQLIIVRSICGAFCERANVTEKVSICANSLSFTLSKLQTNIDLMEEYHQGVYLGFEPSQTAKLAQGVYDVWTQRNLEYQVYMDTTPPQVTAEKAGAWQLGNRFLAAAREAMYLLPQLGDTYRLHRTYQFINANGIGPLFEGYATSLDMLVDAAWLSVAQLKQDLLVTLIVEAIIVQLFCTCYLLYLVQRAEWARLVGVLAMLGLPGPVLRQLANPDTRIVGDSDNESDDDNDDDGSRAGDDEDGRGGGGATATRGDGCAGSSEQGGIMTAAAQLPDAGPPATVYTNPRTSLSFDGRPTSATASSPTGPATGQVATRQRSRRESRGELEDVTSKPEAPNRVGFGAAGSPGDDELAAGEAGGQAGAGGPVQRVVLPGRGVRGGAGKKVSRSRLQINGKTLQSSWFNVSKFMVPFTLWNVAVILVYAISLMKLDGMQGPLSSLNMASHVTYRYTRVRALGAAFVTQDDAESRAVWRPLLIKELELFESEYDAVMYGGEPASMANSAFRRVVPAGTFDSNEFAKAFFRSKACFRYDTSTCLSPGHEYYEVTHNGLDVMVRRMLSEMHLLAADEDADVAYNSSRYTFMAVVGANDLYEGLQQAAQLFVDFSIARYDEVAMLHTILLAVSVVLVVGFFLFVLWPHIRRLLRDAARLGALLSLVPPEMDVRSHVRGVLRRAASRAPRAAAAAVAATTSATGTTASPLFSKAAGKI